MMRNYLCWDPATVRQAINPFAEHIPDSLFRAVHTDWDLQVTPPVGQRYQDVDVADWRQMTPGEFLGDFLRPDRPHALAAILGETGSGKSHLVHWMRLHLRDDAARMVLVVRKSGTSLRAIVREIIEKLPTEEQRGFLDTFNAAGDGVSTPAGRRRALLHHLSEAIREDAPVGGDEIEEELITSLPNLLQDPYMQEEHLLRDGGVAAEIVDHIFERSHASDRPDQRRVFVGDDLAFGGRDYIHATKLARTAIAVIDADRENLVAAVRVINRNLDKAVARTLSFSGDRVEELMARLRTHLRTQGRELVLLVEEFARLQGIDRALLQAITTQGDPGADGLCRMRTAIAVTPGFFESVEDTGYRRTTHIVDMNRSAGHADGRRPSPASVAAFSARYLNAVRLGQVRIETWSESAAPGDAAPSKCGECPYVADCHPTFGEVDGYGLYPFTERALWIGAERVDRAQSGRINPRTIQNDLLAEVLDTYAPTIADGEYPPPKLLEKLGGAKHLQLAAETELQRKNPHLAGRWMALLELYDGSGTVTNLPVPLRDAFSIPAIPDASGSVPDAAVPVHSDPAPPAAPTVSADDLAIQHWIRGNGLDGTVAQKLRGLVYTAVVDAIDWDMLGFSRSYFTSKAFQQRGVSFVRQMTRPASYVAVQLEVDAEPQTGQALQGLLRAARDGFRWQFDGGDRALAAFLDCVDRWTGDVVRQLRATVAPSKTWNEAEAALSLLAIGAALGGKVKADATAADVIDGAFGAWPDEPAATAPELRAIYVKLLARREDLRQTARAQVSSPKGGQPGAMLDPRRVLTPVRQLRRARWMLGLTPPEGDQNLLPKLYRDTVLALPAAAAAEQARRVAWLREMEDAFGEGAGRATILTTLAAAREAALEAGVGMQNSARPLAEALDRFGAVQFDATVAAFRGLAAIDDPVAALPAYGRGFANAAQAGSALRAAAAGFLDQVERNLQTFGDDQGARTGEVAKSLAEVDAALADIVDDLSAMETHHAA